MLQNRLSLIDAMPPLKARDLLVAATFGIACGVFIGLAAAQDSVYRPDLVLAIKAEEGFRAKPYTDTTGNLTIGYGLNLSIGITEAEGAYLLIERLKDRERLVRAGLAGFDNLPSDIQDAVLDLAYVVGAEGALEFTDMRTALETGDYEAAAQAVLDSKFATEDPDRARRIAERISP